MKYEMAIQLGIVLIAEVSCAEHDQAYLFDNSQKQHDM